MRQCFGRFALDKDVGAHKQAAQRAGVPLAPRQALSVAVVDSDVGELAVVCGSTVLQLFVQARTMLALVPEFACASLQWLGATAHDWHMTLQSRI